MRSVGALFLLTALSIGGCASHQAKPMDLPDDQPRVPVNRPLTPTNPLSAPGGP